MVCVRSALTFISGTVLIFPMSDVSTFAKVQFDVDKCILFLIVIIVPQQHLVSRSFCQRSVGLFTRFLVCLSFLVLFACLFEFTVICDGVCPSSVLLKFCLLLVDFYARVCGLFACLTVLFFSDRLKS